MDPHGVTLVNFGLFDLLGSQLSARIRDLGKSTLYRTTQTAGGCRLPACRAAVDPTMQHRPSRAVEGVLQELGVPILPKIGRSRRAAARRVSRRRRGELDAAN
ncbi:Tn3 family transposase [Saccharopolyspora shandongensis]|uniref:Tn3 family transposase n=1 Tax=Saccharopolyspora shandongensis TaxID=418495 RepID=UPI003424CF5E